MKKIIFLLIAIIACVASMTSCRPTDDPVDKDKLVSVSSIVEAASDFYATWEEERNIPATIKVGAKDLSIAEFTYAEAAALVNIAAGKTDDVAVESYKAASNPDRDSYDKDEIAVTNGPADGKGEAEDIVSIATRLLASAKEKEQIPNQVLVYRGSDALAFSTNRAVVTIARALADYAASGKLSAAVSTDYLGGGSTLKAFAEKFVHYYDIWEATVADKLSSDGGHCEDNNNAWERVHFIPIPQDQKNEWTKQGEQWDAKYQSSIYQVEIEGETYTAAQCWEIAIRGLFDIVTTDGKDFPVNMGTDRNKEYHLGNGKSLAASSLAKPSENCIWGKYPWYETSGGNLVTYNGAEIKEVDINFFLKCAGWHVCRAFYTSGPLGMIGNYQEFGTNASNQLVLDGYNGLISSMREFVIALRIYKYILDNNITSNVYDAIKDVKFDFDMYHQELPLIINAESFAFDAEPKAGETLKVTATEGWSAKASESWVHVSPASGAAGDATVTITVDNNTVQEGRTANVEFTAGTYTKTIAISQGAYVPPVTGTLKEFAQSFVTCLDAWNANVGNVDADGTHNGATAWQNVHFIPIDNPNNVYGTNGNQYDPKYTPWVCKVGDKEYTSSQAWEIAIRGLMELCTKEGDAFLAGMDDRNKAYTLGNGKGMNASIPSYSSQNVWGNYPWYEGDKTVQYNGTDIEKVDVNFLLKCGSWHIVRAFVKTAGNASPLGKIGNYQEFGTSAGNQLVLDGYSGLIAPMREMLIAARIYKYILDNNINTNVYDAIKDVKFDFDMYGDNVITIKDFATEYVKLLDVWQKNVGTVAKGQENHSFAAANDAENVHFIPFDTKFTVKKKEFTVSTAMEVAMRSFMGLVGKNGLVTNVAGNGNFAALNPPLTMNSEIPESHNYGIDYWYNESNANGGHIRWFNGTDTLYNTVYLDMMVNFCERNVNWAISNTNWANVSAYPRAGYILDCYGVMIPARCQMALLNIFKMILDENKTDGIKEFLTGKNIDCTLWGNDKYDKEYNL